MTAALERETFAPAGPAEVEEVFRVLAGEHGVSLDDWEIDEQRLSDSSAPGARALPVTLLGSTFSRRDAMSAVARAFDVTPDEAAALTARFLEREGVVRVLADPEAGPEHLRTRSGHVVPATSGDRRYTTSELLAAEQRIINSGAARIGEGTGWVAPDIVERVLRLQTHLDGEQAEGVRALLSSGNGYDLVIGQAGTGKTTLLEATRMAWEQAGFAVIGTAVAARTAADLEAGTGIPSSSLTQLLADIREGGGLTTATSSSSTRRRWSAAAPSTSSVPMSMRREPSSSYSATTVNSPPSTPAGRCARFQRARQSCRHLDH